MSLCAVRSAEEPGPVVPSPRGGRPGHGHESRPQGPLHPLPHQAPQEPAAGQKLWEEREEGTKAGGPAHLLPAAGLRRELRAGDGGHRDYDGEQHGI